MTINTPAQTPTDTASRLRPVARQWVGQTFFGTMMKAARESPLAVENSPFSGGRGGGAFSSLLDQQLAEKAGGGAGEKLVNALVDRIAGGRSRS